MSVPSPSLPTTSMVVGVQRLAEGEIAVERLSVRVEQQLARVAPVPGRRIERAVHTKPVALARGDARQIGVPDIPVDLIEADARFVALVVDQAQLDLLRDLGEQRKVGARAVIRRPRVDRRCPATPWEVRARAPSGSGFAAPEVADGGFDGMFDLIRAGWSQRAVPGHHQPVFAAIWRPSSSTMVRM